jgi:hypothetical protein
VCLQEREREREREREQAPRVSEGYKEVQSKACGVFGNSSKVKGTRQYAHKHEKYTNLLALC